MAPQVALALGFQVDQSVSNCAMACSWPRRFTAEGAAGESGERFVPRLKTIVCEYVMIWAWQS